jgi:hypothetical protein
MTMIEVEREFAAEAIAKVTVRLALGDFKAGPGNGDVLRLRARVHSGNAEELEIVEAGSELILRQRAFGRGGRALDLELAVPVQAALELQVNQGKGDARLEAIDGVSKLQTGKGDISITGGDGEARVQTGKGDIRVEERQGTLAASTGKGDIAVCGLTGALRLELGAGDAAISAWRTGAAEGNSIKLGAGTVQLEAVEAPQLHATTGKGDLRLSQARIGQLRLQAAMGDVDVEGDPQRGPWQVSTAKGSITLRLPAMVSARVEAATRRGTISSDLPQVRVGRPGPASQVGGGRTIAVLGEEPRADISLETIMGDIRVRAPGATAAPSAGPAAIDVRAVELPVAMAPATVRQTDATVMTVLESLARQEISVDEAETLLQSLGG